MASKTIANLAVSLTARIGNFEKGFLRAKKIAGKFAADLGRHTLTIAKYAGALVSAAAAALAFLVKQQFSAIDSMSKLSRTIGLTTEQLAGYQHAADLAGVESEGFNKSILKMNKTIADAQNGSKSAAADLARVGISVKDLAGLSTDARIKLLADRYTQIGDAAQRSDFLVSMFGKSGGAMGSMLEQGAQGIRDAQAEAEKLGLTVSKFDATKVEVANDAFTKFKALIVGIGRRIAVLLSDYVYGFFTALVDLGTEGEGMGEKVTNVFNWIMKKIGQASDTLFLVKAAFYAFQATIQTVGEFGARAFGLIVKSVLNVGKALAYIAMGPLAFIGPLRRKVGSFFDGIAKDITGVTDQMADDFGSAAFESIEAGKAAVKDFENGLNSKKLKDYFQKWRSLTAAAARDVMTKPRGDVDEGAEVAMPRHTFGQQIEVKNVALGAAASAAYQGVTRKQGDVQIKLLQTIANRGAAAVVV